MHAAIWQTGHIPLRQQQLLQHHSGVQTYQLVLHWLHKGDGPVWGSVFPCTSSPWVSAGIGVCAEGLERGLACHKTSVGAMRSM